MAKQTNDILHYKENNIGYMNVGLLINHTTTWVKLVLRVFLPNLENSAVLYSDLGKTTFSISRI
jgi:hypothetical protein